MWIYLSGVILWIIISTVHDWVNIGKITISSVCHNLMFSVFSWAIIGTMIICILIIFLCDILCYIHSNITYKYHISDKISAFIKKHDKCLIKRKHK